MFLGRNPRMKFGKSPKEQEFAHTISATAEGDLADHNSQLFRAYVEQLEKHRRWLSECPEHRTVDLIARTGRAYAHPETVAALSVAIERDPNAGFLRLVEFVPSEMIEPGILIAVENRGSVGMVRMDLSTLPKLP